MLRIRQVACLDQLWRALLNASRRLWSHLRRCDTSSLSAPALLLLPIAPNLRRLRRQLNQRQPPRSPDLLRVGEIEGAHARHDATPSRSAKDPGPRSGSGTSWTARQKEEGPESCYRWTNLQAASNVPLATPLNAGCRGKCVYGSSRVHSSAQVSSRCQSLRGSHSGFLCPLLADRWAEINKIINLPCPRRSAGSLRQPNSGLTTLRSSWNQGWVMYLRCSPLCSEPRSWHFPCFPPRWAARNPCTLILCSALLQFVLLKVLHK